MARLCLTYSLRCKLSYLNYPLTRMNCAPQVLKHFSLRNFKEHLLASSKNMDAIQNFCVAKASGKGLERYLKENAVIEEKNKSNRTYLVKDKVTDEIAGYFSLRTGLFTLDTSTAEESSMYSVSAIELSNFAVNSAYKDSHPDANRIGYIIFTNFVIPIVRSVGEVVGVQALYIYALPEESLIDYYKTLGFSRLSPDEEDFVHKHVKPKYDTGCYFMYQII